jgi:hypothetical protein
MQIMQLMQETAERRCPRGPHAARRAAPARSRAGTRGLAEPRCTDWASPHLCMACMSCMVRG